MHSFLRVGGAAALALVLTWPQAAGAGQLVWQYTHDEESAFLGVVDADNAKQDEPDYPFSMQCSVDGDETTVVSDVDAKALGKSISNGEVPSFHYVIDGKPDADAGGEVADIRFNQLSDVWQYIVNGADTDLLTDASTIRIDGTGVGLDLPQDKMQTLLKQFKDACDTLESSSEDGEEDDSGQ
jgi:hypothetical protein